MLHFWYAGTSSEYLAVGQVWRIPDHVAQAQSQP